MAIEIIRDKSRLSLDETGGKHEYRLDGRAIPSCTAILARCGYSDLSMVPKHTLEAKSDFGTRVHELTHWLDEDDLDLSDLIDHPEYMRRVEGWSQFKEDWGFVPEREWSEQPLAIIVHGQPFGVKPDRFGAGNFGTGGASALCTVEIKSTHDIERSAEIQTAAQSLALKHRCPLPVRMICQLTDEADKTGRYYRLRRCDNRRDEAIWLACLAIEHDKRNHGLVK